MRGPREITGLISGEAWMDSAVAIILVGIIHLEGFNGKSLWIWPYPYRTCSGTGLESKGQGTPFFILEERNYPPSGKGKTGLLRLGGSCEGQNAPPASNDRQTYLAKNLESYFHSQIVS